MEGFVKRKCWAGVSIRHGVLFHRLGKAPEITRDPAHPRGTFAIDGAMPRAGQSSAWPTAFRANPVDDNSCRAPGSWSLGSQPLPGRLELPDVRLADRRGTGRILARDQEAVLDDMALEG